MQRRELTSGGAGRRGSLSVILALSDIGRALAKPPGSLFMFVAATNGISLPARKRRGSGLTFQEREEISRGLSKNESQRSIAARLRRAVSTVSREVARNGGSSQYRAAEAETAGMRISHETIYRSLFIQACGIIKTELQAQDKNVFYNDGFWKIK